MFKRYWNSLKNVRPLKRMKLEGAIDPMQFVGRRILARPDIDKPDEEVLIADVRGCVSKHLLKHFQINGTHLVSMFSFYTQMMEGRQPTAEEEDEFNLASDVKNIRKT